MTTEVKAVLWDFGGVILESPFDAFARYELERALPEGFLRSINATNPDTNAWAQLERRQVTVEEFCGLFEEEARRAGHDVVAMEVLGMLSGSVRPQMVQAVRRCHARLKTGLLTNNFVIEESAGARPDLAQILELFHVVVESSRVGVRKPDPRFYELACQLLEIEPREAVFLDDLGINLKPARAMGMRTIKVADPDRALDDLEAVVGFAVR